MLLLKLGEMVNLPKISTKAFWSFNVRVDFLASLTFWRLAISPSISEVRLVRLSQTKLGMVRLG